MKRLLAISVLKASSAPSLTSTRILRQKSSPSSKTIFCASAVLSVCNSRLINNGCRRLSWPTGRSNARASHPVIRSVGAVAELSAIEFLTVEIVARTSSLREKT